MGILFGEVCKVCRKRGATERELCDECRASVQRATAGAKSRGASLADLELIAQSAGFADYRSLLYELYVVRKMGQKDLGRHLRIHYLRVREHLALFCIPIAKRGGQNHMRVVITQTLLDEITRDGVPTVAKRLKMPMRSLYRRLRTMPKQI